jgi:hypothetical protein
VSDPSLPVLVPGPAPGFPWALTALFAAAGVGVMVLGIGLWFLWGPRLERGEASPARSDANRWQRCKAWRDKRTEPTRLVLGLCGMLGGYHIAAYALPESWMPLRVPIERWWILALGIGLAIVASLRMDAWEREDPRLAPHEPDDRTG